MSEAVKLLLYEHAVNETIVHSHKAKTWDDFMFVVIETYNDIDHIASELGSLLQEKYPDKTVFFLDSKTDISIYGLKAAPETEDESSNES